MLPHCAPNATLTGPQLLVTTHSALIALRLDGGGRPRCTAVLDQGRGHYYSAIPLRSIVPDLDTNALLVGSQFLGSRRSGMSGADALLALGGGGGLLEAWPAHTRYLHATEWDRTSRALVSVDALSGKLELHRAVRRAGAPSGVALEHAGTLATGVARDGAADHLNNVAFTAEAIWAMRSQVRADHSTIVALRRGGDGDELASFGLDGRSCHQLVWRSQTELLYLNSSIGGLAAARWPDGADPAAGAPPTLHRVWAAGAAHFSKGLTLHDDVAYVGLAARQGRADGAPCPGCALQRNDADAEVAAVDLASGELLWRAPLPVRGLVNAITHLAG